MKKQIFIGSAIAIGFLVILGGIKGCQIASFIAQMSSQQRPPEAVTSYVAKQETWPRTLHSVGSLVPVQGATLSVEEAGKVQSIHFESGQSVEEGDLLVSLNVSAEEADLAKAKSTLELAKQNAERQRALRKRNANAQADLDNAEESLRNASAEVERINAIIAKKQVIAPFSGKAGIRLVNKGQTISAGTPVVELNAYSPLYVNFTVPQRSIKNFSTGDKVHLALDAFPDKTFEAELTAVDSRVSAETRTISLQATVENSEELLRPGMFVDVDLVSDESDEVISIPASSINYAPYGSTVYVIAKSEQGTDEQKAAGRAVTSQVVKTGRKKGDRVEIVSGISAGDEVVSSGTFKLRPGVQVVVNNVVTPENKLNPQPADT